jgi:hypothetical protein
MGPYAGVDCIVTLMSTLESSTLSLQYIYHDLGNPYARVYFIPQSGTLDLALEYEFVNLCTGDPYYILHTALLIS